LGIRLSRSWIWGRWLVYTEKSDT